MNDVTTDVGDLPLGVTAVSVQSLVNSTPFGSQNASNLSAISAITAMVGLNVVTASPEVTTSPEDGHPGEPKHYPGAEGLESFGDFYKSYHGYIASAVCVFGIIANILNIIVLTRKNMISATNCILTGLAVSDGLTMVAYLPFALRFYCLYGTEPTPERNTLNAVRFMLFYACFSVVVHTVSIWLTVTLAVFRYIFIRYPRRGAVLCTLNRAKLSVFLVYLVTLVACVPNFVSITILGESESDNGDNSTTVLWFVTFKLDTAANSYVYHMNFWIQAIIAKLVPCIGLTILSFLLIKTMKEAERRRQMLRNKNASQKKKGENHGRERRNDGRTHRTTVMLLTVVFLFLLTEFPQGILNLLSGILPHFVKEVYGPLGDLMDILALINNGINFILYCTMSKQFRDTFIQVFFQIGLRDRRTFALVPQTVVTKTEYEIATTQT